MKSDFINWYKNSFDLLRLKLIEKNESTWLLDALFPGIEIAALKHFDSKEFSTIYKLKWYHLLLFRRAPSYELKFENSEKFDVIFWPSQQKHYALQLPVYHQLKKLNVKVAFISTTISLEDNFKHDNVNYIQVLTKKKNKTRLFLFLENYKLIKQSTGFETFKLNNKKIYFDKIIADALTYRIPCDKALAIYNLLKKENKPKIIFLGYSFSTVSLSIDKKCEADGVLTASIQMGRVMYYLFKYSALKVYYNYGRFTTNNLKNYAPELDVIEVGSVKMEITENAEGTESVKSLTNSIRKDFTSIGLVAFSGPGLTVSNQGHIENLKILKAVIDNHPEVFFIFKFHGKDSLSYYVEFQKLKNILIIDQSHPIFKFDIMHLIKECDLLISGASTTVMEASYWLKPVISLDALDELKYIELIGEEFIFRCRDIEDLNASISSIIERDSYAEKKMELTRKFSEYSFSKSDVPSSKRIAIDVVSRLNKIN